MARNNEIYNFNNFIDGNDKLNRSNLSTFYLSYFDTECVNIEISNDYCSQDTNWITLPPRLWELYRKFERNLKLIWDDKKKVYDDWETNKEKLCSYLKYWIYDRLISEKVTDNHFSKFFKLWDKRKIKKCSNCDCEFKIKSFSEVKQLKKTYDYSLFLKEYKNTSKINNQISNKKYCKYIENAKAIYSTYEHRCKTNFSEYCKEFNKYVLPHVKYKDSRIYNVVQEDEVTAEDEDTKKGEDDLAISCKPDSTYDRDLEEGHLKGQVILKELAERKENEQEDNDQLEEAEEDDTARVQSQQDAVLSLRREDPSADHVLPDTFPGPEGFMHTPGLDTGSEGNGNPIKTITSASLVGVPSIIFLLYKFSPVRTWLDPRIRKTKSDLRNSIQGSNELQSHDYNFDTTNIDFNRFNVGYQSR
ncbi:PIR protein [Plasmodium vivax]|uniref:VIR protein n=1 Tax=Plasmodium vivax TaxID=5855 RepID=A0A564ZP00_PLAVI|nr:PIR protein [Plasmodium vivax]